MGLHVAVVGTGYLGAVHAAGLAAFGHEVVGVDVDAERVAVLSSGAAPFYEPGLEELLADGLARGRLRFSTRIEDAAAADVCFVCVGTPAAVGGHAADLSAVDGVFTAVQRCEEQPRLLVGKSTVPVGTAERLVAQQSRSDAAEIAWNPEFLREGHAVQDTLLPDRLVLGVQSSEAEALLRQVYEVPIEAGVPVITTDLATAQLTKVAANSYLATKISFINAMADLCEASGADVVALADAIGHDVRIGRQFLNAGLGFGGGCLPKDIRAFMARAGELGVDQALTFLREVDAINMRRRQRFVDLAHSECDGDVLGKRIAVLGAAFKPDSDDVRDSPALNVAARLQLSGGEVCVYDPAAVENARRRFPTLRYADRVEAALEDAELVLLLTEWRQFRELDPEEAGVLVAKRRIIDGRNALDPERWRAAGWSYRALGRRGPL